MKVKIDKNIVFPRSIRSSLLVPEFLIGSIRDEIEYFKGLDVLLRILLRKYYGEKHRLVTIKENAPTIQYQEKSLNLHRLDFRPLEKDWIELKLLSNCHNMSICAFFVLLFRLYLAGALENLFGIGALPPFPKKIILQSGINHYIQPFFKKIFYIKT